MSTSFRINEYSDSPDILCLDSEGNKLNIEITLTEDREGDIQAALGRSNSRSLDAVITYMENVRERKASLFEWVSSLNGNVSLSIAKRIKKKLQNDYGPNVALLVRDTSGVDWDWNLAGEDIKKHLDLTRNSFDQGIWIISNSKDKIFHII